MASGIRHRRVFRGQRIKIEEEVRKWKALTSFTSPQLALRSSASENLFLFAFPFRYPVPSSPCPSLVLRQPHSDSSEKEASLEDCTTLLSEHVRKRGFLGRHFLFFVPTSRKDQNLASVYGLFRFIRSLTPFRSCIYFLVLYPKSPMRQKGRVCVCQRRKGSSVVPHL